MFLRRTLAVFTFATAIVLPATSFADEGSEPAEAPAAEAPAVEEPAAAAPEVTEGAPVDEAGTGEEAPVDDVVPADGAGDTDDAEGPRPEKVRGVKLVELPVHAADRARERVAFAHERRDLHKAEQAAKQAAENGDAAHGERPEKGEKGDKHLAVTADRRAAAAALRETASERRGQAKERRETAKEKRAQAADHVAQVEERKAAAAEKRADAEDKKAKGEEKRGEHKK